VTGRRFLLAATDDLLDVGLHVGDAHADLAKHSRREAVGLGEQPEEQMFGSDIAVLEPTGLYLG
jgi:hypothetical protein